MDNDYSLSLSEVVTFLKSITDDLSTDNIERIFDSLDQSGDRSVDFTEFKVNKIEFENVIVKYSFRIWFKTFERSLLISPLLSL